MALAGGHAQIPLGLGLLHLTAAPQKVGGHPELSLHIPFLRPETPVGQGVLCQRFGPGLLPVGGRGQQGRSLAVPLLRRPAEPLLRLRAVLLHAGPRQIAPAQLILDLRVVLIPLQKVPKSLSFFVHASLSLPSFQSMTTRLRSSALRGAKSRSVFSSRARLMTVSSPSQSQRAMVEQAWAGVPVRRS